jgi:hypothetical protein
MLNQQQLNLLSQNIDENEKNKIFFELTLKLLHKNNFEEFNEVFNYYENYSNYQLEEILKMLIKNNKKEEITTLFTKHNINITTQFLQKILNTISIEIIQIIFYFLPNEIVTQELLNCCTKKEIIVFLTENYSLDTKIKETLLLRKVSLMHKMENYIHKEENLYTLRYFKQYLELKSLNNNIFEPLLNSIEKLLKRDYSNKNTFLSIFSTIIEENNEEILEIIEKFLHETKY